MVSSILRSVFLLIYVLTVSRIVNSLSFANSYGDYMVLQQAPYCQIWGYSNPDDKITVNITNSNTNTILISTTIDTSSDGIWKLQFSPPNAKNDDEYIIAAKSSNIFKPTITLQHILFGDVFVCSGQSNMQFTVDSAFNATESLEQANNYPNIRVFTVGLIGNVSPQNEVPIIEEKWSIASNISIGGGNWSYFSALCWFYGINLYSKLNYPIGLIDTAYGGTPIRYWMSPDALSKCPNETISDQISSNITFYNNNISADLNNSYLWNAMIYPFLRMSIKGAIWYQGESDTAEPYASSYQCAFPAMIEDWRSKWLQFGGINESNKDFPFGFVHLSTWNDQVNVTCNANEYGCIVATVRYGQTANYGFVPNDKMVNVFLATAIDLGDPNSPWTDIHPRYKQQVGKRLSDAALNMIYEQKDIYWLGPIANKAELMVDAQQILIEFDNVNSEVEIKNNIGFEIYNGNTWIYVDINSQIINNGTQNILISLPTTCNGIAKQIRYNWYQAPCMPAVGILNCAIYDMQSQLPALPFILSVK